MVKVVRNINGACTTLFIIKVRKKERVRQVDNRCHFTNLKNASRSWSPFFPGLALEKSFLNKFGFMTDCDFHIQFSALCLSHLKKKEKATTSFCFTVCSLSGFQSKSMGNNRMPVSFLLLLFILIFALFWEDTKVKVLASDSLLSPKGVNYEGEVTVYMSLLLFGLP